MWPNTGREARVGAVIVAGLAVVGLAVLLIGNERNLFTRKARYLIRFPSANGLGVGSPVQLSGVKVGAVARVELPENLDEPRILVAIAIDGHHTERVRADSVARIKTLGLLGDRYVEITSGSKEFPPLAAGAEIPAAAVTDMDKLIASGEDMVENVVGISHSLNALLQRLERGEGLLGELTTDSQAGRELRDSAIASLAAIETVAVDVRGGKGAIGRLLHDEKLGDDLAHAVARLDGLLTKAEGGQGLLPALLDDPATRDRFTGTLTQAEAAIAELGGLAGELRNGKGLIPRLIEDERYGQEVAGELQQLIRRLNGIADKLDQGDGTVGRLINDPSLYEAANDIVVGVNDSRMLRWLLRNRQRQGIENRYELERRKRGEDPSRPPTAEELPPDRPPAP